MIALMNMGLQEVLVLAGSTCLIGWLVVRAFRGDC